jgi:nucleotide-binding universal stress UspA family protein
MYDDILVPVDGSAPSDAALAEALSLAETFGATVHALYVVDEQAVAVGSMEPSGRNAAALMDAFEAEGERVTADAAARAGEAGVSVETTVGYGSPHREILDYVSGHGVDLVVMGTHGRRGLERAILGSVTERVLRLSDVPVLTVHEEPDEGAVEG